MKDAAKIYGEALYELARSEELDGQLLPQLRGAAELLTGAPEYQYILSSPAISKAERTGLLDQAFSGQVHPYVLNFMKILCEAGAISVPFRHFRFPSTHAFSHQGRGRRADAIARHIAEALRRHRKDHPADLPDRPGLPGRRPCGNGRPAAGRHSPQTSGGYE